MDRETYALQYAPGSSPGWDAIDKFLSAKVGRAEPDFHFAPNPPFALGGQDPLDGISVYIRPDASHLHFISYGLSNLYYDEDAVGGDFSGWGFELTFRLAVEPSEMPREAGDVPKWPMNLMQNLARYVISSKKWFEQGHYIDAKGPIKSGAATDYTALLFWSDPELTAIDTPHGHLDFLQFVGITAEELHGLQAGGLAADDLIKERAAVDPLLITIVS